MKKYGVNDYMHEGPLAAVAGGVLGGLLGGGGTLAGFLTTGGLIGSALGAVGGTLLGNALTPKFDTGMIQQPQQPPASAVPPTPAAPAMPAAPSTPGAGVVTGPAGQPAIPVDTSGPGAPVPFNPGEGAPLTTEGVAKGEMTKKRRGRVATILTTPASRAGVASESDEDAIEMLGG